MTLILLAISIVLCNTLFQIAFLQWLHEVRLLLAFCRTSMLSFISESRSCLDLDQAPQGTCCLFSGERISNHSSEKYLCWDDTLAVLWHCATTSLHGIVMAVWNVILALVAFLEGSLEIGFPVAWIPVPSDQIRAEPDPGIEPFQVCLAICVLVGKVVAPLALHTVQ